MDKMQLTLLCYVLYKQIYNTWVLILDIQMLIVLLIIFFIVLIVVQLVFDKPVKESYVAYDTTNQANALILAQTNASNITMLEQNVDNLSSLQQEVSDLSGNVVSLNAQVQQLINQNGQLATQLSGGGGAPPVITGLPTTSGTT